MAKNNSRSKRQSMLHGTVEGKYIQSRPDTETDRMNADGDRQTMDNKRSLNPLEGFQSVEYPTPVYPVQ